MLGLGQIKPRLHIVGVGLDGGAQVVHRPCAFGLAGKSKLRMGGFQFGGGGDFGGRAVQCGFGLVKIAGQNIGTHQTAVGGGIVRVFFQNRRKGLRRLRNPALGEHLFGRFNRLGQSAVTAQCRRVFHKSGDFRPRNRALEAIDRLALPKGINRRDGLHAQLSRDALVLIHVDLDHPHRAACCGHCRFELRAEGFARAAPRRPKIDDHRHLFGGLDDIRHKGRLGDVFDQIARRGILRLAEFQHGVGSLHPFALI